MHSLPATVTSRVKLSLPQLERIRKSLNLNEVTNRIDESIAGGILIQIGDRYLDYTLDNALEGHPAGEEYSVGLVQRVGDGVALVDGLSTAMAGEIVEFETGAKGLVMNLQPGEVGVVGLSDINSIKPGHKVRTTGRILSIPASDELIGRVIDPLGNPLDGKGNIPATKLYPLEKIAPGVMEREPVSVPVQTGIKAIDAMIPIGRGQRELIIGDRQTGKTSIALTTIINQRGGNLICIYVAIGQKQSSISQLVATLESFGAMQHTIVVVAAAADAAALQYLAPYGGTAIGEYFLEQGRDALIIYDDLSKHAWAYRQISLLLRRPSGREAYPGDIFYAHSRLLERACRLSRDRGGGSLTALPIIETQAGDVSAYIPTNVISITDGQIYLEASLFNAGQRPAINIGNSVSRVGGAAQIKAMKQVAGRMRLDLAQYRELSAFAQFSSDLDEKTQSQLNRGAKLTELLKQSWDKPMAVEHQIISIWAASRGFLDDIKNEDVVKFEAHLIGYIQRHKSEVIAAIKAEGKISDALEESIEQLVKDASLVFIEERHAQ